MSIVLFIIILVLHWLLMLVFFLFYRKNVNYLHNGLFEAMSDLKIYENELKNQKHYSEQSLANEKARYEDLKKEKLDLDKRLEILSHEKNKLEKSMKSVEKDLEFEKSRMTDYEEKQKILKQELTLLSQEQMSKNQESFKKEIESYMQNVNSNFSKDFVVQKNEIQKIQDFQKNLNEIIKNVTKDFHSVKDVVTSVKDSHDSFIQLLHPSNIKQRGNWGEWNLQTILDKMGLKEKIHYQKQFYIAPLNENDSGVRLDYLLHFPNNMSLIIDCKTPSLPFIENKESFSDDFDKKKYLDQFEQILKDLVRKNYLEKFRKSEPDYQLMDYQFVFLPNQVVYYFVSEEVRFMDYAFEHKIIFTSPGTMISYLTILRDAWKNFSLYSEITQNMNLIKEIVGELSKLYYCVFDIGTDLESLRKSYNRLARFYQKEDIKKLLIKYDEIKKNRSKSSQYTQEISGSIKQLELSKLSE